MLCSKYFGGVPGTLLIVTLSTGPNAAMATEALMASANACRTFFIMFGMELVIVV